MDRWIVVVDGRQARRVLLRGLPGGHWHAEPADELHSQWEDRDERSRPSRLGGRSGPGHQHAVGAESSDGRAEARRRFAVDLVDWMERTCGIKLLDEPEIFVSVAMFAPLREELGRRHHDPPMHEVSLLSVPVSELATHPAVIDAVGSPNSTIAGRHL